MTLYSVMLAVSGKRWKYVCVLIIYTASKKED